MFFIMKIIISGSNPVSKKWIQAIFKTIETNLIYLFLNGPACRQNYWNQLFYAVPGGAKHRRENTKT